MRKNKPFKYIPAGVRVLGQVSMLIDISSEMIGVVLKSWQQPRVSGLQQ